MVKHAVAYAAKFVTALVAVAAVALSQGLLTGTAAKWVAVAISLAGAFGVYLVPNAAPASGPSPVPPPTAKP